MTFVKGRILYTEDDPDSRDLVIFILKQNGYHVTCTENGTEALTLAKNQHFDLFLVDNWLPGLTGPDLTRHIREFNQITPILFYSAAAYDSDRQNAVAAGAQGYLVKPVAIDLLVDEVTRLIAEANIRIQ
jgi:CheY-like chemotaxis protein